ncbi:MAG: hypothetical protein ABL889_19570 [Terricaulis sp.]
MLFDLAFIAVGIIMVVCRKPLARAHLQMQKKAFNMRGADDPRTIQATETALLVVGIIIAMWCLAEIVGLGER